MIGILKKCLEGALAGKRCTMGEMGTIMAEAAQMVNSRPIARSTGDPETGGPITPLHLLLGRASVEVPQVRFTEAPKLTQRLQFVENTKKQFWQKWMSQVFGGRMLSHKWTKKERDVAAGDVVLLAGQSARERAVDVFSLLRVWDTAHNNGVLIYLLLADVNGHTACASLHRIRENPPFPGPRLPGDLTLVSGCALTFSDVSYLFFSYIT